MTTGHEKPRTSSILHFVARPCDEIEHPEHDTNRDGGICPFCNGDTTHGNS